MSSIYTRLHRIFSTTHKTTTTIKLKPKTPKPTKDRTQISTIQGSTGNLKPTSNSFIADLLSEKDSNKLFQKFNSMSEYGYFRRQYRVYDLTIYRLTLANQISLIEKALDLQKKYISRESFAVRIIYLYGKAGMFDHAHHLFDELPERKCQRGAKSFNALLGAAVNAEKFDKAYELFREIPTKLSIKPDGDCYSTAANALCKLGLFNEAVLLLDEMEENGLKPNVVLFNTLIGAFYGKGDYVEGEKIWERMIKSNVVPDMCSYGYKMQGLAIEGKLTKAIDLVEELKSKGQKLNVGVFNALIQGFCKSDDLGGAREWYSKLLKHGCVPNRTTFDILVPFLCEKGDYGFAFKVCKKKFMWVCSVNEASLQNVVDGLVKKSMIEEAKTLVELGRSNSFFPYDLTLPSTV